MGQKQVSLDLSFAQEDSRDMSLPSQSSATAPTSAAPAASEHLPEFGCVPVLPEHIQY